MSKMSNEYVRDAEARSLDNAEEVARLRFAVAELLGFLEGLESCLREHDVTLEHRGRMWSLVRGLLDEHGHI